MLNEMTIGRTDDPENPSRATAFKAAGMFGTGSRVPSGPAVIQPRQQAGHMIAIDPSVGILNLVLASKGPSTHARRVGVPAAREINMIPAGRPLNPESKVRPAGISVTIGVGEARKQP